MFIVEGGAGLTGQFQMPKDRHGRYIHKAGDTPDGVPLNHHVEDLAAFIEREPVHTGHMHENLTCVNWNMWLKPLDLHNLHEIPFVGQAA
jgi:hypothetical protein